MLAGNMYTFSTVHRGDGESTPEVNKLLRIVFCKCQLLTLKKSYMLSSI